MSEAGGDNLAQKVGAAAGILAALLILRRLRKRRKAKKLAKARAKARAKSKARAIDVRVKEEKARGKAGKKSGKGFGEYTDAKTRRNRTLLEQTIRIVILAFIRKFVLEQMGAAAKELNVSKLGKKVVEASGA